jgi:hypothetical protein
MQDKEKMNNEMVKKLIESINMKDNNFIQNDKTKPQDISKLKMMGLALIHLNKENDSYKNKILSIQEQKFELIEIINSKNQEFQNLSKEHRELKDEYEHKAQRLELSTTGSGSYGIAHSDSLTTLFNMLEIKVTNGRYCEENIKTLVTKLDQILITKNNLETDNKYLRDKLDEVNLNK